MAIDEIAEDVIAERLAAIGDIAYYSEDRGTVRFGSPRGVLVIDPIDGTRPAAAGFEACVVSIAVAPHEDAMLCRHRLRCDRRAQERPCHHGTPRCTARRSTVWRCAVPSTSDAGDLRALFWGASQRARPSVPVAIVLERLIDNSAMRGGYFDLGSSRVHDDADRDRPARRLRRPRRAHGGRAAGARAAVSRDRRRLGGHELPVRRGRRVPDRRAKRAAWSRRRTAHRSTASPWWARARASTCRSSPPPTPSGTPASSPSSTTGWRVWRAG